MFNSIYIRYLQLKTGEKKNKKTNENVFIDDGAKYICIAE